MPLSPTSGWPLVVTDLVSFLRFQAAPTLAFNYRQNNDLHSEAAVH